MLSRSAAIGSPVDKSAAVPTAFTDRSVAVSISCGSLNTLCRLGEIRDRSFEQQRYRASSLTLVTAAIVLWNRFIERAIDASTRNGQVLDAELLKYLSRVSRNTPRSGCFP
jgi:hypothetical protein